MSFQAYPDTIEKKTGLTPRRPVDIAREKGFDRPDVKAGEILTWLKDDYDLGRGHGMALVHVIQKGPTISSKHVESAGVHRDESETLWLDGISYTLNLNSTTSPHIPTSDSDAAMPAAPLDRRSGPWQRSRPSPRSVLGAIRRSSLARFAPSQLRVR